MSIKHHQKAMTEIVFVKGDLEKLNDNNYNAWSMRVQFYLMGEDLWDIVGGSNTTPPTNLEELKKWKVKAGKAMYMLSITIQDNMLYLIKDAKTPKDAWDILAAIFARTNDAQPQQFKNELLSISPQNLMVS